MSYLVLIAIKICLCGTIAENNRWEIVIDAFQCTATSPAEFECIMPMPFVSVDDEI